MLGASPTIFTEGGWRRDLPSGKAVRQEGGAIASSDHHNDKDRHARAGRFRPPAAQCGWYDPSANTSTTAGFEKPLNVLQQGGKTVFIWPCTGTSHRHLGGGSASSSQSNPVSARRPTAITEGPPRRCRALGVESARSSLWAVAAGFNGGEGEQARAELRARVVSDGSRPSGVRMEVGTVHKLVRGRPGLIHI